MSLSRIIGNTPDDWLLKVIFYDKNLHPIQTQSNNLINYTNANTITDYTTTVPDFAGQTTVTQTVKNTGTTITVTNTPIYDPQYRVKAIVQQTNNANATAVQYNYSEAGQMIQKGLGVVANPSMPANLTLGTSNSVPSGSSSLQQATNSITITPNFTAAAGSNFIAQIVPAQNLQLVDYRYNIRGQLVNINNSTLTADGGHTEESNNSVFGMQLLYNTTDANLTTTPYYNGKLSAVKWMSKDASGADGYERAFAYSYDALDRYTKAAYADRPSTSSSAFTANNNWTEAITGYDENGNISGLTRNASTAGSGSSTPIDNLTYTYNSNNANQLSRVTDATGNPTGFGIYTGGNASGNYSYDANGNITADPFKNITTTINVLNKTDVITVNPGSNKLILYNYDASGNMIRKVNWNGPTTTTTDYLDGFVYINGTLSYYPMPEGRMVNNGGTLTPQYVITDQQGNARVMFDNTGAGVTAKVIQENSYYGLGMTMPGNAVSLPTPPNKNLYNGGSELQNDFNNLPDLMQTFYRNYDAALGRWTGVDPQADNGTESLTPYQYAGNNPIMNNDPLGNKVAEGAIFNLFNGNLGSNQGAAWVEDQDSRDFAEFAGAAAGGVPDGGTRIYQAANGDNPGYGDLPQILNLARSGRFSVNPDNTLNYWTNQTSTTINPNFNPKFGVTPDNPYYEFTTNDVRHTVNFANSGGPVFRDASGDLNSTNLGVNYFGLNFLGPHNPTYNNGNEDFNVAPVNKADYYAKPHDIAYLKLGISGPKGVYNATSAIGADYSLVANEFGVYLNPLNTPAERIEGFFTAWGIGLYALPKTISFGVKQINDSAHSYTPDYPAL